ncbi:mediator of RNA polymerase II transcription subunit 5 [Xylaria bambusicola]|uniref:mediator of RNA polymerase II transcription subunit 5 n=1 Tax=Xylaria bambusicola TaxID=326684 RepID=UPI00200808D3|nr:mediator of RNA polymerase II transcription subunit 5 [Xylaria bambusicola]KAI0514419.1 mediator of RNA polymerase II transcription subunit 5 [Xylaria bambusicola]
MDMGNDTATGDPTRHHHGGGPTSSQDQWARYLSQFLNSRLDPEEFESYVPLLYNKHPLPPVLIADIFLRPQPSNHESLDPRISRYLEVLTQRKLVDTPSILNALYRYSTSQMYLHSAGAHGQDQDTENALNQAPLRWASSYTPEEVLFYRLSKAVRLGSGIKTTGEALGICVLMARWMTMFTTASTAFAQDVMGQLHNTSREEMEAARAAFVMLLLSVCENHFALRGLSRPSARDVRRVLSESLTSFIPSILQSSSQIASRLELFRTETLASFEPIDKDKKVVSNIDFDDLESSMVLDSIVIPELPISNSRAGLYIYLNASLVGRPLIDDAVLFSYLHNRYQGDIQTTTIDLILASFDVLANAVFRNEGQKTGHLLRSYLINKLPLLLATLANSMFAPLTPQYCITEALAQVDTNAFPTLSAMFDDTNNNNTFTDSVRQDFCFACCLHGLIPESSIEGLLGEITYQSLPQDGRQVKEKLVERCIADPERIQELVREIDNMDGNAGAVCQALIEMIGRLCANKETMSLKLLCSQLAQKPLSLDVMLLFGRPASILHPLCEVLDNWRYDEDQGEYQPVYEEFGAILLLVLAFVYRYNLSAVDLGIRSSDTFIAKLLNQGQLSRPLDELTDSEKGHLDGWIVGLFDTETGGLGDELISTCPPQDFYLLVPTLFYNIMLAYDTKWLAEESLKTGVEYLVDTFLLPSLVVAITYMSNQLWTESRSDQKAVIAILQLILLNKKGSDEAQTMLSAVLNIVAKPLEHSLRSYQRQDPKCQEIEPLLNAIKDNLRLSRRTAGAGHNELEAWASTASGGLAASVRHTIQGFLQWSLQPGNNIMPTSYTHRQILAAHRILGARRLLGIILDEVKQQTDASGCSIMYDIATALICAPDATNVPPPTVMALLVDPNNHPVIPQTRMTLREALKSEAEDFKIIQNSDPALAEHIVRLYRRVEAQLMMPQPAETMLQTGLGLDLDGNAAAALGVTQGDGLVTGDGNLSLNLGNAGSDMGLTGGADSGGGLDFGTDDDIFGNLGGAGSGADLLEGWGDGMDLS